jgi:hypothetical protein
MRRPGIGDKIETGIRFIDCDGLKAGSNNNKTDRGCGKAKQTNMITESFTHAHTRTRNSQI